MSDQPNRGRAAGLSRKEFCARLAGGFIGAVALPNLAFGAEAAGKGTRPAIAVNRAPSLVRVFAAKDTFALEGAGPDAWENHGVAVRAETGPNGTHYWVTAPTTPLVRLHLRWRGEFAAGVRLLGDTWERSYGDLEWRGLDPDRPMPWYFLALAGRRTDGYGVRVRPNAFCCWTADEDGVSLWIDVRSGGAPVRLGNRELSLCTVTTRTGQEDESAQAAARVFCRQLCSDPRLPTAPILGANDWYYTYGHSQPDELLRSTARLVALAPAQPHRLISVIDGGWAPGGSSQGPWNRGTAAFGSMAAFASRIRATGAEAGLWFRPLAAAPAAPASWRLARDARYLDPSRAEVLEQVRGDTARFREWGYTLIKHDFSTWDILGKWGNEMGSTLTVKAWTFADSSRTTAEIILALYGALRAGAGDALVMGCNTVSHLSAGLFELNRIGDDVSGKEWDRTRRMGVNTIAFRGAQHGTFYAADPDIVAITPQIPWPLAEQWLRLVGASRMALFVSAKAGELEGGQGEAVRAAFAAACAPGAQAAVAQDWQASTCPRDWLIDGCMVRFDWLPAEGVPPSA